MRTTEDHLHLSFEDLQSFISTEVMEDGATLYSESVVSQAPVRPELTEVIDV